MLRVHLLAACVMLGRSILQQQRRIRRDVPVRPRERRPHHTQSGWERNYRPLKRLESERKIIIISFRFASSRFISRSRSFAAAAAASMRRNLKIFSRALVA